MPRKKNVTPSYLLHSSGQARVRIDGRDILLGEFGSDDSRRRFGELIAQHAGGISLDPFGSNRGKSSTKPEAGLTVNELCLTFMRFAGTHYVKGGKPTSEICCLKLAITPLVELYGHTAVDDFGPLALKAIRITLVEKGWVRNSVNRAVGRIRHVFKWGVENELVSPATLQKLQAIAPLLAGRTEAHDNAPRTAVADSDIRAVQEVVSPLVKDLIELQRLIGARSGELLSLTTGMIDRSGPVWLAKLVNHKNIHHGQARTLAIGPKAQLILTKYLSADPSKPLFPMLRTAYCRAITRACDRLEITRWVPHQLRHTAADNVRSMFGLEHTQAVLGHAKADMSEHYAKVGMAKVIEVAGKVG